MDVQKRSDLLRRAWRLVRNAALLLLIPAGLAWAQTGGDGAIQGTVTDPSGAVVANATVTATNIATNAATVRNSSSAGFFSISPLPAGTYTVTVTASGFQKLVQTNIAVNALQIRAFNPVLKVGATDQTVTVTAAPPVLDTQDATLGMTVQNETYSNLPIQVNGQQRDPTAFAVLTPGAQGGTRLPIIGGTGNYLGQLYLDGMPAETINQQGDNRLVSQAMDLDAVDQFQVLTSTPPAQFMGAGAENFTMKSGGLKYHGQVSDFIRNTIFDTWGFTAKGATTKNAAGQTVAAPKPSEHQNEISATIGGKVPHTGNKLFFFFAYDNYFERLGPNYSLYTVPTALMRKGDFTELSPTGAPIIFDPTTTTCAGSTCTRKPFQGLKNGVPTNNVIPDSEISPIAQKMESFLPAPSNSSLSNNYLGGLPRGFNNHAIDWRVDFDLSDKHRLSTEGAMGAVNYLNNFGTPLLPLPYTGGDYANIWPKDYVVSDTYTFTPNLVNQIKFSYTRFFQKIENATQGKTQWEPSAFGITDLPPNGAQAAEEFPEESFGSNTSVGTAQTQWTGYGNSVSTQLTTPNNYAATDNLQWVKGKHSLTFGLTYEWEEINNANPSTYSGVLQLPFDVFTTAQFDKGNSISTSPKTGYSYASFLLGGVGGSPGSSPSLGLQPVSELGGRYHVISPYVQDSYKVTKNLTLDLGLRWDYLPPYHEEHNRWTFLNPNLTNPIMGTPGLLQFAGDWGGPGVSCMCTTPVKTYWNNWGPRVGLAWQIGEKNVIRAGFAQVFTQAGGVGGRGGAANGTGQTGFNVTAIGRPESTTGPDAGPSFYLNNSADFTAAGIANTDLFGRGFVYPAPPSPGLAAQTLNTGFYLDASGKFQSASSVGYADPYFSGRAPEIEMFNFGVERAISNKMTLALNYVGNESHFIVNSGTTGSNARGYWTNELNPVYLATLGGVADSSGKAPLLTAAATPANVAILHQYFPNVSAPGPFEAAAAKSSSASIQQLLKHFPQYSGVSDTWGNVSNFSYNSLQATLERQMSRGLSFNVNYTFAKNVGDDGTFRSGFDIPAAAISGGGHNWKQDRIDRSLTADNMTHIFHAFGVWQLPFGKGHIGNDSRAVRWLGGGWQLSSIYSYRSDTPIAVTWGTNCLTAVGECMPDKNGAFSGPARINGKWGRGPNGYQAASLGKVQYIDKAAFATPQSAGYEPLIGNAPRTHAYGLTGPSNWDWDAGMRRSFPIHENLQFVFEADCIDVANHVNFSTPSSGNLVWSPTSTTFGTVTGASGNRDWQFAGHITF
ncbi:MAG TPA: TonB-dependent receptor [Acidobacteriaceae bacterium]|nr:TonB-dependent receptor [Acidobacteriaceae bacterium]